MILYFLLFPPPAQQRIDPCVHVVLNVHRPPCACFGTAFKVQTEKIYAELRSRSVPVSDGLLIIIFAMEHTDAL